MTQQTYDNRAKEFYAWCKNHGACTQGLRGIRGKTFEDWWTGTVHSGWDEMGAVPNLERARMVTPNA